MKSLATLTEQALCGNPPGSSTVLMVAVDAKMRSYFTRATANPKMDLESYSGFVVSADGTPISACRACVAS